MIEGERTLPAHENLHENAIAKEIVDAAFQIHTKLGPGLLESVYEVILAHELRRRGLHVQRQLPVPIVWEDIQFEEGYRLDLMVEGKGLVEIKSVSSIEPVPQKTTTYLFKTNEEAPWTSHQFQRRTDSRCN